MSDIKQRVIQTVGRVLRVPPESVTEELRMGDLPQWDSLNHMAVISAVERDFDLVFDLDDVVDLDSVADLVELVERLRDGTG